MRSLRRAPGYLIIDHSDSPGVSAAEVAGVPGALAVGPGEVAEFDTKLCAHCQAAVLLNPNRVRPRGYCSKCDAYICDNPICNAECRPFVRLFERAANAAEKLVGREPDASPLITLTDSQ